MRRCTSGPRLLHCWCICACTCWFASVPSQRLHSAAFADFTAQVMEVLLAPDVERQVLAQLRAEESLAAEDFSAVNTHASLTTLRDLLTNTSTVEAAAAALSSAAAASGLAAVCSLLRASLAPPHSASASRLLAVYVVELVAASHGDSTLATGAVVALFSVLTDAIRRGRHQRGLAAYWSDWCELVGGGVRNPSTGFAGWSRRHIDSHLGRRRAAFVQAACHGRAAGHHRERSLHAGPMRERSPVASRRGLRLPLPGGVREDAAAAHSGFAAHRSGGGGLRPDELARALLRRPRVCRPSTGCPRPCDTSRQRGDRLAFQPEDLSATSRIGTPSLQMCRTQWRWCCGRGSRHHCSKCIAKLRRRHRARRRRRPAVRRQRHAERAAVLAALSSLSVHAPCCESVCATPRGCITALSIMREAGLGEEETFHVARVRASW